MPHLSEYHGSALDCVFFRGEIGVFKIFNDTLKICVGMSALVIVVTAAEIGGDLVIQV
ncbi:hypothetical protein [Glaciimonas immobilis]|uniref:Uncharacterized protein n=1 Tax=Glaciimonas immobilis TaxID=728004 RepID=A0A840RRR1_9BURK|nr:hypothetical protein [Glaciimonas immobilis]KAF3997006.1 hypothetical protein HAV38_15110 [Glaciimonas immobilis]MBB5199842.1 hypothetical protein [Glaciimonas immobilis]